MTKPHHKLQVWRKSPALVKSIYGATAEFPDGERYGLVAQMRRAAVSIPSNIAEGAARNSHKEFVNFLHIAQGSLAELETQILLSGNLGIAPRESCADLLEELEESSRKILGLQRSLKKESDKCRVTSSE